MGPKSCSLGSPALQSQDKPAVKVSAQRLHSPLKAHLRKDLLLSHFQALSFSGAMDGGASSPVDIDQRPPPDSSHCRSLQYRNWLHQSVPSREGQAKVTAFYSLIAGLSLLYLVDSEIKSPGQEDG